MDYGAAAISFKWTLVPKMGAPGVWARLVAAVSKVLTEVKQVRLAIHLSQPSPALGLPVDPSKLYMMTQITDQIRILEQVMQTVRTLSLLPINNTEAAELAFYHSKQCIFDVLAAIKIVQWAVGCDT